MDNETAIFNNWTEFSIDNEKIYHISIVSHIINIAISFLTVILNSIVLSFIRGHRKEISDVIFKQILCLSVTDLFAGFAPALFTLTLIETVYQSAVACLVYNQPVFCSTSCCSFEHLHFVYKKMDRSAKCYKTEISINKKSNFSKGFQYLPMAY